MDMDEARKRNAQDAELAGLEAEVGRLATAQPGPVMLAIVRALVEKVCASQGEIFIRHHKIRFYRGVLAILRFKGIS